MAITTQDGLISARANKRQSFAFSRTSIANMAAGQVCSLYRSTGGPPTQPAIPTTAAIPTKTLSLNFNNATSPDKTYLDYTAAVSTASCVLWTYDRLFHIGGFSGIVTTAQTVNSQSTLTFPARGGATAGEVEWFLEWYADTGATAVTANVAVTYTDATTGTVAVALAATMRAGRLLQIPPVQGKVIASVQSVTLSATTGTAGNFGVTCGERCAGCALYLGTANIGVEKEAVLCNIPDDGCFWHVALCTTTSTGDIRGEFTLLQG